MIGPPLGVISISLLEGVCMLVTFVSLRFHLVSVGSDNSIVFVIVVVKSVYDSDGCQSEVSFGQLWE